MNSKDRVRAALTRQGLPTGTIAVRPVARTGRAVLRQARHRAALYTAYYEDVT